MSVHVNDQKSAGHLKKLDALLKLWQRRVEQTQRQLTEAKALQRSARDKLDQVETGIARLEQSLRNTGQDSLAADSLALTDLLSAQSRMTDLRDQLTTQKEHRQQAVAALRHSEKKRREAAAACFKMQGKRDCVKQQRRAWLLSTALYATVREEETLGEQWLLQARRGGMNHVD